MCWYYNHSCGHKSTMQHTQCSAFKVGECNQTVYEDTYRWCLDCEENACGCKCSGCRGDEENHCGEGGKDCEEQKNKKDRAL